MNLKHPIKEKKTTNQPRMRGSQEQDKLMGEITRGLDKALSRKHLDLELWLPDHRTVLRGGHQVLIQLLLLANGPRISYYRHRVHQLPQALADCSTVPPQK